MRTLFIRHRASRSYQCLCHLKKRYFLDNIQSRSSTLYYSLLYRVWRTKSSGRRCGTSSGRRCGTKSSGRRIRQHRRQHRHVVTQVRRSSIADWKHTISSIHIIPFTLSYRASVADKEQTKSSRQDAPQTNRAADDKVGNASDDAARVAK